MFYFIFGFLVGIICCLYYIARAKEEKTNSSTVVRGHSIFLNFIILEKDEMLQAGVEEKMQGKMGRGFVRDKIAQRMGKIAAAKVSDETIGGKIGEKMCEEIPGKMSEMGIVANASKVYGKGSFFVIRLSLVSADIQQLVNKAAGKEKGGKLNEMMSILGGKWAQDSLRTQILPLLCSKIQKKLPDTMREKFASKGLTMDITVKTESEEAEYFFDVLEDQ